VPRAHSWPTCRLIPVHHSFEGVGTTCNVRSRSPPGVCPGEAPRHSAPQRKNRRSENKAETSSALTSSAASAAATSSARGAVVSRVDSSSPHSTSTVSRVPTCRRSIGPPRLTSPGSAFNAASLVDATADCSMATRGAVMFAARMSPSFLNLFVNAQGKGVGCKGGIEEGERRGD